MRILTWLFGEKKRVLPEPAKHVKILLGKGQIMHACQTYQHQARCTPEEALKVLVDLKGDK